MDDSLLRQTKYLAARYTAGTLQAKEIANWVDELTDLGIWVESFIDIIDANSQTKETLAPFFAKCIQEFGLTLPDQNQYLWCLIDFHLQQICNETVTPMIGVNNLMEEVFYDPRLNPPNKGTADPREVVYSGASYGVFEFIQAYWIWDDVLDKPHDYTREQAKGIHAKLEETIRHEAQHWVRTYGHVC